MKSFKKENRTRNGFTLIELLSVIAILGVLSAILIPTVQGVRERGWKADSVSNMRQLYTYLILFANEHHNQFPGAWQSAASYPEDFEYRVNAWWRRIDPRETEEEKYGIFAMDDNGQPTKLYDKALRAQYPDLKSVNYAMNTNGLDTAADTVRYKMYNIDMVVRPAKTVLLSLASPLNWNSSVWGYGNGNDLDGWPSRPYDNTSLICFFDGHVETVEANPARKSGLDLPDEAWMFEPDEQAN